MEYEFSKENFDYLMEKYKKLSREDKRNEIIDDIKFLLSINKTLCEASGEEFLLLYNKAISDYEDNNNEDNFLEAVYAYLYLLKYSHNAFIDSLLSKED